MLSTTYDLQSKIPILHICTKKTSYKRHFTAIKWSRKCPLRSLTLMLSYAFHTPLLNPITGDKIPKFAVDSLSILSY